jgi:murein DD-endopeptidase MepM/ murein hydrolase activator NlpD
MEKITTSRWFNQISWGITIVLVLCAAGFVMVRKGAALSLALGIKPGASVAILATPTAAAMEGISTANLPSMLSLPAIERKLTLKTVIPERPRTKVFTHTVARGDSVFGISKSYNIKPDTLLWANYDVLNDTPDSLRTGQELNIPPTDGILYTWEEGDTLDDVVTEYKANVDDLLNWPGNKIDLSDPSFKEGDLVMIPGGSREFKQWLIPTIARGSSGTTGASQSACGGGPVGGGGFIWPSSNNFISGNDYYAGHLAIDIAGAEGDGVWASDAGVVVKADSGWNGGYGNVVMIDHGNGYATLYAHLSTINAVLCQGVGPGTMVGAIGNTGNSFGSHLHFEVRLNGGFINPWNVLGQ